MKTTAYLRVSTDKQDEASQRTACAALATSLSLTIDDHITEKQSGGIAWQERRLSDWISDAQPGDILLISEISRIARSLTGIMSFLEACASKKVRVHCNSPRIDVDGSIQSAVLVFAFGIAAQIERDLIRSRTKNALAERKRAGVVLGRPAGQQTASKLDKHADAIRTMLAARVSNAAIGRTFNCSRQTVCAWVKNHYSKPTKGGKP
jgi:DNA invertase Pin-like site-specific DNA recombinase